MSQNRRLNRQLELPMLGDVKAKASTSQAIAPTSGKQAGDPLPRASEHDLSVYRRIAENYFRSLKQR